MTDENGHCIVQNFTVGRLNYGNIFFEDSFDVAGLNLDALGKFLLTNNKTYSYLSRPMYYNNVKLTIYSVEFVNILYAITNYILLSSSAYSSQRSCCAS
jgi:hypothetical protein